METGWKGWGDPGKELNGRNRPRRPQTRRGCEREEVVYIVPGRIRRKKSCLGPSVRRGQGSTRRWEGQSSLTCVTEGLQRLGWRKELPGPPGTLVGGRENGCLFGSGLFLPTTGSGILHVSRFRCQGSGAGPGDTPGFVSKVPSPAGDHHSSPYRRTASKGPGPPTATFPAPDLLVAGSEINSPSIYFRSGRLAFLHPSILFKTTRNGKESV